MKHSGEEKRSRAQKRGRKKVKAKAMLFKLKKPIAKFLRGESRRSGKDMVQIVEEMLQYRMRFPAWPPLAEQKTGGVVMSREEFQELKATI
jgi:hypothetical protein